MNVEKIDKEGAQRLYERLGYDVVGEFKDYIISGHSEILLRKTIAPLSEYPQGMTGKDEILSIAHNLSDFLVL